MVFTTIFQKMVSIGLSQIWWRYIISGCKHRVFHRFLPVLASPGLSWQTIYEIPWVMKEALFTRKVLERSWKVYLILSTHILQGTNPLKWILMAHQWGTRMWPYGADAGFKPLSVSGAAESPVSWTREKENNGSKPARYTRGKCWRGWKNPSLMALKAALLTWGLAAVI